MTSLKIITFKGCQPTVDLRADLEDVIAKENLQVDLQVELVHSPQLAEEKGLFGSPTIILDGNEIQRDRRGPAGFF